MVPGTRTTLRNSESAGLISRIVERFWIRLLTLRAKCGRAGFFVTSSGSKCTGSIVSVQGHLSTDDQEALSSHIC